MSTLLILNETHSATTLEGHGALIRCCTGLRGRIGDKYQPFRDAGDVEFTEGMDPKYYYANKGVFFDTIIDGRTNDVYVAIDEGLDRFPD